LHAIFKQSEVIVFLQLNHPHATFFKG
jgi:hypothetical protein